MNIAILSDIHDNIWNLNACFSTLQRADLMICCGDICSPFMVRMLAENFEKPIHYVFGNNDGDLHRITRVASGYPNFHIRGEFFEEVLFGKRFAVNHYDTIALGLARSKIYDVVCFGHNHRYQVEKLDNTQMINPGAIMGYSPLDDQEIPATFVIYDVEADIPRGYRLKQSVDRNKLVRSISGTEE